VPLRSPLPRPPIPLVGTHELLARLTIELRTAGRARLRPSQPCSEDESSSPTNIACDRFSRVAARDDPPTRRLADGSRLARTEPRPGVVKSCACGCDLHRRLGQFLLRLRSASWQGGCAVVSPRRDRWVSPAPLTRPSARADLSRKGRGVSLASTAGEGANTPLPLRERVAASRRGEGCRRVPSWLPVSVLGQDNSSAQQFQTAAILESTPTFHQPRASVPRCGAAPQGHGRFAASAPATHATWHFGPVVIGENSVFSLRL